MAKPLGMPTPVAAALLSGAVKARPGRKAAGPIVKAPTGVKSAPARPGLLPAKPPMPMPGMPC